MKWLFCLFAGHYWALIAEDPAIGCALYKCMTCSRVREMDLPKRIVMFGAKDVR